ncbi:MAG: UDP-N-acetylmuramoyl-tripeptide--D-alanyl-D-alanine ligase [Oligosphaeraceae bacterium]
MERHHHYDDAPRFTWDELTAAAGGEWLLAPTAELAQQVLDDSRRVAPGDLFVAIVGELADGHRYVTRAAEAGVAAVLVERQPDDDAMLRLGELGCGCLLVPDSLSAFMALAEAHRLRWPHLPVVGVTGSCGKTSSKEMCAAVLATDGTPVLRTRGNTNNFFGVPRNLLRLDAACGAAVIEMGSNHPGEIRRLASMTHPTVGLVCNIGAAHLEFFGDLDGVAEEKGDLLEALPADGVAVMPAEAHGLDILRRHAGSRRILTFGEGPDGDVRVVSQRMLSDGSSEVRFAAPAFGAGEATLVWRLGGRHQALNAAGALAVGLALGIPLAQGVSGLAGLELPGARMRVETLAGVHWVDDAYNANPTSMAAALDWFAAITAAAPARTLVLGDMRELGAQAADAHERLLDRVAREFADARVLVVGEAMEGPAHRHGFRHVRTAEDASAVLAEATLVEGEWVLLKGSNSIGLSRLVPRA